MLRWHDILQADYTLDQFKEFDEEFKNVDTIIQRRIRDGKLANREEIEKIYLELCSWAAEIRSQYTEDLSDLEE